jgi:hypothetical protein
MTNAPFDVDQRSDQDTRPACDFAGSLLIEARVEDMAMAFEVLASPVDFLGAMKPT